MSSNVSVHCNNNGRRNDNANDDEEDESSEVEGHSTPSLQSSSFHDSMDMN